MKNKELPSQERLHYLFYYNPESGKMYHRFSGKGKQIGGRGNQRPEGYRRWYVDGHSYREHRLIWCYMTGDDPASMEIDHIDNDRNNNKWSNLRLATHKQNANNWKATGIQKHSKNSYSARIKVDYNHIYLGSYKTEQEAHDAYIQAKNELHGEFSPYQMN